uniref:Uncharacterized protein n=1 Tax=mine drainage metagenome TaxID=410659 RepID=E6QV94_9ZZZZ
MPSTILFAARLSAVVKKPRLRITIRRSSSLSAVGSFHCAMSRLMLISCGIQWLAQPARYLSHAHLYLNGTNWFTSAVPLMMRLSSARTRPKLSTTATFAGVAATECPAVSTPGEGTLDGVPKLLGATEFFGEGASSKFNMVIFLYFLSLDVFIRDPDMLFTDTIHNRDHQSRKISHRSSQLLQQGRWHVR